MKSAIFQFTNNQWQSHALHHHCDKASAQLLLCFAARDILISADSYDLVRKKFPVAEIVLCSTAGEIFQDAVQDNSFVAAAISFEKTDIASASVNISEFANSYDAATALVKKLPQQDLAYILVLSDGGLENGRELVKGLNDTAGRHVLVTGGLAGDGSDFKSTVVGLNQMPVQGQIAAIGFYGSNVLVTHGTNGGWQTFGLEKEVTKSNGNKLFEVDNHNVLDIYKKYLGPEANNLPGSALMFPLSVTIPGGTQPVVRTILSIDHEENSMTFAGDIPQGSKVRFMRSNYDQLAYAAELAAQNSVPDPNIKPAFSLLVSCVGRKIILGPRIEEEVEAVLECLGDETPIAGFYSYGEISPFNEGGNCQLHNQTMTITSFYELP